MRHTSYTPRPVVTGAHAPANATPLQMRSLGRYLVIAAMLLGIPTQLYAQCGSDWYNVGNAGFSNGAVVFPSIAVDGSGNIYAAYRDDGVSSKGVLKKFNGSSWVNMGGSAFTPGTAQYTSLVLDPSGTPYVAFRDGVNGNKATVMLYDGSGWSFAGSPGLSAGTAGYTSLAMNSGGILYLAYADGNAGGRTTVRSFDGVDWQDVGSPGFSGVAQYVTMAFDPFGTPYVAYAEQDLAGKSTVMKYEGGSWVTVGSAAFSTGATSCLSLAFENSGRPYLACIDENIASYAIVRKFDGSSWGIVGSAVSSAGADHMDMAMDASGTLYVTYADAAYGSKNVVKKFDGSNWVDVGTPGTSLHTVAYNAITTDASGGIYVFYQDGAASIFTKGTVQAYFPTLCAISGTGTLCQGTTTSLSSAPSGGIWSSSNTTTATVDGSGVVTGVATGTCIISYTAYQQTVTTVVTVGPIITVNSGIAIYSGGNTMLTASGGTTYSWSPVTGLTPSMGSNVSASPAGTTTYTVTGTTDGCSGTATAKVIVAPLPGTVCNGWETMGDPTGSIGNTVTDPLLYMLDGKPLPVCIGPDNKAYVAYKNPTTGLFGVKKFNGTNWTQVSGEFMPVNPVVVGAGIDMKLSNNGTPYFVFMNRQQRRPNVYKAVDTGWLALPFPLSTSSNPNKAYPSITFDGSNNMWLANQDPSNANYMGVQKFNGSTWSASQPEGHSSSGCKGMTIAVTNGGVPYLSFLDPATEPETYNVKVLIYNAGALAWSLVGGAPVLENSVTTSTPILKLSPAGTPYLAYSFSDGSGIVSHIKKYNGSAWVNATPALSASEGTVTDIRLDANEVLYAVTVKTDISSGLLKPRIRKYVGTSWIDIGTAMPDADGLTNWGQTGIVLDTAGAPVMVGYDTTDHTLRGYAYKAPQIILTATAGSNGTISPSGATSVCNGSTQIYTITPSSGHHVADVTIDGSSVGAVTTYTFAAVAASHTISATFAPDCTTPTVTTTGGTTIFQGNSASLTAGGATTYTWSPATGLSASTGASITASPAATTIYTVTGANGTCTNTATVAVNVTVCSDQWIATGTPGFTSGFIDKSSIAVSNSGTPYLVYSAGSGAGIAMKYNGSSWGNMSFPGGMSGFMSVAVNNVGTPYVAFMDGNNSNKATVRTYNGASWTILGSAGFSAGGVGYTSLALNSSGTPYVAYSDGGNSSKATVMKYNGTAWETVGSAGFSAGTAYFTSLALASDGTPYVLFYDVTNGNKTTVMKFNGSTWVNVGSAGFSTADYYNHAMAISSDGTPYVAYDDATNDHKLNVVRYNGSAWEMVGSAGFTPGSVTTISMIMINDRPYVAFNDGSNSDKARVMKYYGGSWVTVGAADISASGTGEVRLAKNSSGATYVGYQDYANGSKATVQQLLQGNRTISASAGSNGNISRAGDTTVCAGTTLVYTITPNEGQHVLDVTVDGSSAGAVTSYTFAAVAASHTISATFAPDCTAPIVSASGGTTMFQGGTATLSASGATTYTWSPATGLSASTGASVTASPATTTIYTVTGANGTCTNTAIVAVNVTVCEKWDSLGGVNFAGTNNTMVATALGNGNTPYIAYPKYSEGGIVIKKYYNGSWTMVGNVIPEFSGNLYQLSMTTDGSGTPYLLFTTSINRSSMFKFNGTDWIQMGEQLAFIGAKQIVASGSGTPYITTGNGILTNNGGYPWTQVGGSISGWNYLSSSIALDGGNMPYIAFKDGLNDNKLTVKKFNGSSWVEVGAAGISTGAVDHISLDIDGSGTPLVAYKDLANSGKTMAKKFNGTSWVAVGSEAPSTGEANFTSLVVNSSGTPYVAYVDVTNSNKPVLKKYNGSDWVTVSNASIAGSVIGISLPLLIDSNDVPIIAFVDDYNEKKITAAKLLTTPVTLTATAGSNGSISPAGNMTMCPGGAQVYTITPASGYNIQDVTVDGNSVSAVATYTLANVTTSHTVNATFCQVPTVTASDGTTIYQGQSAELTASGATTYSWSPSTGLSASTGSSVMASPTSTTTYTVTGTSGSCSNTAVVTVTVTPVTTCGAVWNTVGDAGSMMGSFNQYDLAVDNSGTPYMVYGGGALYKATVIKYDGSGWETVGGTATSGASFAQRIGITNDGTPYIAYSPGPGGSILVKKYTGSSWEMVGNGDPITCPLDDYSFAVSGDGTPYVAYRDSYNGNKATVKKYDGTNWVTVGDATASSGSSGSDMSLKINASGTPYLLYTDDNSGSLGTVVKYNGSAWVSVGSANFTPGAIQYPSLAFNSSGTPYVAFQSQANSYRARTMKYNGTSWEMVGGDASSTTVSNITLAIDESGIPMISYIDGTAGSVIVTKYNGTDWATVGGPSVSALAGYYPLFANNSSGAAYVTYVDPGTGYLLTVKRQDASVCDITGNAVICGSGTTTLSNATGGGTWSSLDPTIATVNASGVVTAVATGTATIRYIALGHFVFKVVTVGTTPTINVSGGTTIFQGNSATLTATGGTTYSWTPVTGLSAGTGATVTATPANTTTYTVTGATGGCSNTATATVGVTTVTTCGDVWGQVGENISNADATSYSLAISNSGIPYAIFEYQISGYYSLDVKKYNGTEWQAIGENMAYTTTNGSSILIDNSGIPYIAYYDNYLGRVVVRRNVGYWERVGDDFASTGAASGLSFALDQNGTPYVAYTDADNSYKVTVRKYDGTTWVTVGSTAVSAGTSYSLSLKIDASGTPYVFYHDLNSGGKGTVAKYDGTAWVYLDHAGFTPGNVGSTSLTFHNNGTPYVAFSNAANSNKVTVMKYNGSSWETVGSAVSSTSASFISVVIDDYGTPLCCYSDATSNVLVKKYDGSNWTTFGSNVASGAPGRMVLSAAGQPHVIYVDATAGYKVAVKKFISTVCPLTGTTNICVGGTTTIASTTLGGTWASSSPSIASVGTNGLVTGVAAGTAVISYSALSQTLTTTVTVTGGPTIDSAATITSVSCYGQANGSVTPHVSGSAPLTWIWSNGSTTSSISGLAPGTYTYTVSNSCGSTTATATVTQPSATLTASNTTTSVLCYGGSTGTVSVTATGGTSPYTGTGNFTGRAAGTHSFTVTDANGCTANTSATVSQPVALTASKTITDVLCYGNSTGSVSVTATGGTTPYSGTGNMTGLSAGAFSYTVTDANGCTSAVSGTVDQPAAALSASNTVTNVLCFGASTGSVSVTATGGTTPYSGDGNKPGKAAGTYSFTVTDAHGCTATTSGTVTQPASGLSASSVVTSPVLCHGGNATITVSATGGTGTYSGTGAFTRTAGTYTFTVTDASACPATTIITVTEPTTLVANKSVTHVRCFGENNGQVIVGATGGTSPYTGTGTFSNLSPEPYSYTVTDNNGCTSTVSGTITQPALLVASNTPNVLSTGFNLLCNKGNSGIVNVSATGGTTPYNNTGAHTGLYAGSYEFYVTDAHGCIDSTSGDLSQPPPFYITTSTSDDTICNGESVSLTGHPTDTVISYYRWLSNNGISTTNSASPVTATPTTGIPTTTVGFVAIGYNGLGCPSEPDTVDVTVLPIGYFTGPNAVCTDYSVDLDNGTPGGVWYTPDTSYITVDQDGLVTAAHEMVSGTYPTNATITYTMPNGCMRTKVQTVNLTPKPVVGIGTVCPGSGLSLPAGIPSGGTWASSNSNITVSVGSNSIATIFGAATGTANVSYIMPTGCYSYKAFNVAPLDPITGPTQVCTGNNITLSHPLAGAQWSSNNPSMATINVSTGVVSGLSAATAVMSYKVNPTCYVTYTITVNTTPAAVTGPVSVCKSANITLADATAGGTWVSDNTSAATVGSTTGVVNGADVGVANISYVMPTGCYKKATVTVNDNPAAISGATNVCVSRTSAYSIATTGGTWSSSSSALTINAGSGVASGVTAGNANISYTLGTGCYSYKTVTIAALPAAITGTTTMCENGTTTLTSTTPSLTWSSTDENVATVITASTTTGTVSGLLAGTSTISYTSAAGCTQTVNVTVYAAPATIGGTTNICVGSTATYTNSVTGGTWASSATGVATVGSSTGVVTGIGAGAFTLTYAMPGGCKAFKTVSVDAQPAAITGTTSTCVGGTTTLSSTTTGQTWSSVGAAASIDASTGVVTGAALGTALISYTNAAGCTRTTTINVSAGLPAIAGPSSICVGGTATLTCTTAGGTWSSSNAASGSIVSTSGAITGVATGTPNITYRTSPTCFTTTSVTVISAPAAITGPSSSVCQSATLQLSHTTGSGTWTSSTTAKAIVDATGLVSGVTAGTTTISYVPAPGCLATYVVSVNAIPNAITGTATVCDNATTTLATTSTGGSWISSSTGIATVGTSGIVTGADPGTSTISYKFSSTGCYVTKDVTVNALPNAITGDNAVCAGLTDTFANTTGGGTWSSSATGVATIGSATGILNGVAAGTTTLSYNLPTGCRTTKVFSVNAIPATGITGTATVCEGATTTLTCTTAGQTWSSTNTAKATIVTGTSTTGIVTGVAAGTVTISYTNAAGCARTTVVTVGIMPASISGTTTSCTGRVDTLTSSTNGGLWSSSAPSIATIGSLTGYLTGVAAGTTTISYSIGNCRRTGVLTVNAQPGSISGPITICGANTTTLTATNSGGTWATGNADVATVVTASSTTGVVTGGSTAGTVSISYTLVTGCARVLVVTVAATLPTITGPDQICIGTTGTYVSGTGGTWISSATAKASIGFNTGVATGVATGTTTISYKVHANCFTTRDVTVNAAMASITGTTNVCVGSETTLSCTTPGGEWSSSNTGNATIGEGSGIVTGMTAGTAYVTYQVASTGCFKTASVNVLAAPAPIEGTLILAVGATTTLNNTVTGGTWSSSASTIASIGSTTGIMNGVSLGGATITYKLSNGCYKTAGATVSNAMARSAYGTGTQAATITTVRIFPNPSQGNITVETPASGVFSIYTMDGKEVNRYDVIAPATAVSLPYDLAAGMYMCRFEGADGVSTVVRLVYKP